MALFTTAFFFTLQRNITWLKQFLSACVCVYSHHHALNDSLITPSWH